MLPIPKKSINRHVAPITIICIVALYLVCGVLMFSLYYLPLKVKHDEMVKTTCIATISLEHPMVCTGQKDCYWDGDGARHCKSYLYACNYTDITWTHTTKDGYQHELFEKNHPPSDIITGHTETCWYPLSNADNIMFDDYESEMNTSLFGFCIVFVPSYTFLVIVGIIALFNRCKFSEAPREFAKFGPYEFVMAHHKRVGGKSSIYRHFRNDPLYAPPLSKLILSFVDQNVTPPGEEGSRRPRETQIPECKGGHRPQNKIFLDREIDLVFHPEDNKSIPLQLPTVLSLSNPFDDHPLSTRGRFGNNL